MADKTIPALKILRGNVGVNTATPTEKLYVDGAGYFEGGGTRDGGWHRGLEITTQNANFSSLYFGGQSTTKYSGIIWTSSTSGNTSASRGGQIYAQPTSATNTDIRFDTNNAVGSSSPTLKMIVRGDGKVGIGVAGPSHLLQVNGTVSFRPNGSSNNQHYFTTGGANNAKYMQYNSAGTLTNQFATDADSYITGGSVGISTNAPAAPLNVNGGAVIGGITRFTAGGTNELSVNLAVSECVGFGASNSAFTYFRRYSASIETLQIQPVHSGTNNGIISMVPYGGQVHIGMGNGTAAKSLLTISGNSDGGDDACALRIIDEDDTGGSKLPAIMFYGGSTIQGRIRGGDGTFAIAVGSTPTTAFSINTTSRKLTLGSYGSGTHTGTATYKLSVDSSGNVIETAVGSGQVDGSGTANYISKWTDGDTLGNASIYDNGSNRISLGTVNTSPWQALHVQSTGSQFSDGASGNNNYNVVVLDQNAYTSNYGGGILFGGKYNSAGGATTLAMVSASKVNGDGNFGGKVHIGGREHGTSNIAKVLTVTHANVGIGETDPDKPLHIKGTNTAGIVLENTTNATNIDIDYYSNGGAVQSRIRYGEGPAAFYFMPHASQTAVTMAYDGNVGINTTSPNAKLHIESDGSHDEGAEIALKHANNNSTDVVSTLSFQNNSGQVAMIQAGTTGANNTGYISLFTDNAGTSSEKVRIIGDGNVGIGTDNPSKALHVIGAAFIDNTESTEGLTVEATTNASITLQAAQNTAYHAKLSAHYNYDTPMTLRGYGGTVLAQNTGNTKTLLYASNAEEIRITTTGVGIGLGGSDPTTKLHVGGGTKIEGPLGGVLNSSITRIENFILDTKGEDAPVINHQLNNDLALLRVKGNTVTYSGLSSNPGDSETDRFFEANSYFGDVAASEISDASTGFTITLDSLPRNLTYTTRVGISFATPSWRCSYVKIEVYRAGAWNTIREETSNSSATVYQYYNTSSSAITKIRYTLKTPVTTSLRIVSLFAFNYNSTGATGYYLSQAGGTIYGTSGIILNSNDADVYGLIGRARIGYLGHSDIAGFCHRDMASTVNYALIQSASGHTYVNAASGQQISFRIANSDTMYMSNTALQFNDNKKVILGNDGDLEIYHNSADSFISDVGTGNLVVSGSGVWIKNAAINANMIGCVEGSGGYVKLYQNGNEKLATSSAGVTVTGRFNTTGRVGVYGTTIPTYSLNVYANTANSATGSMHVNAALNGSGKGLVITSNTRTTSDNSVAALEIINRAGGNTLTATVAGFVGIGTASTMSSSGELLGVYSASTGHASFKNSSDSFGTVYIRNVSTTANTWQPYLILADSGGNRGGLGLKYSTAGLKVHGQGGIEFWTGGSFGGGSVKMTIASGGALTVAGNATFGSAATKLKTYSDSTYSGIYNGSSLGSDEAIYFGAGVTYFYNDGATSLVIAANKRVQLQATDYQIQYQSGSHIWFTRLTSGGTFAIHKNGVGDYFQIGSSGVAVFPGGSVGIGDASPQTTLAVNGEASFGDGSRLSLIGLSIASSSASPNIKIRTKIPFALGSADFTVNLKGFIYGNTETANLTICWHYYNSTFYNASCSSAGGWAPTVQLSAEDWDSSGTKKVCICLSTPGYWVKMYVESMFSHSYNDAYADGWTWVDGTASGTGNDLATASYKADFGRGFKMENTGVVSVGNNFTIPQGNLLYLDGGSNTYIYSDTADSISYATNSGIRLITNNSGVTIPSNNNLNLGNGANNTGIFRFYNNNSTAHYIDWKSTGARAYQFLGSSSSADYVTTFKNAGSGGHDLSVCGQFNVLNDAASTTRFWVSTSGVVQWGSGAAHGTLTWDTDKAVIGGIGSNNLSLVAEGTEVVNSTSGTWDFKKEARFPNNIGLYWLHANGSASAGIRLDTSDHLDFRTGGANGRMTLDDNGNLGIGRPSPYGKLDIESTDLGSSSGDVSVVSRSSSDVGSNTMYLLEEYVRTSAGSDWTTAGVRLQAKTDSTYQGYIQFNGDSNNYGLSFGAGAGGTSSPGTTAERMRIQSDGKVGIGTTDPSAPLEVYYTESSSVPGILLRNTSNPGVSSILFEGHSGDRKWACGYNGATNDWRVSQAGLGSTGNLEYPKLVVRNGGNVGVGYVLPAYKLEVAGDGRFSTDLTIAGNVGINGYGPSSSYGLLVGGNAQVAGSFSASSKSFLIDHPTKENKKLEHGCLEGPEFGVYYRGRAQSNTITLPDYWTGLVREDSITVQLTPKGSFQHLYVVSQSLTEIVIGAADGETIDCFYTIYGERADIDRLEVEKEV